VRKAKPAPEPVAATPVTFDKYIVACKDVAEEFRDALADETARMMREKSDKPNAFDPQHFAHLHRLRVAADSFLAALGGVY
jgi:hypothetical protein